MKTIKLGEEFKIGEKVYAIHQGTDDEMSIYEVE